MQLCYAKEDRKQKSFHVENVFHFFPNITRTRCQVLSRSLVLYLNLTPHKTCCANVVLHPPPLPPNPLPKTPKLSLGEEIISISLLTMLGSLQKRLVLRV